MDYSASEQELAEELHATRARVQELEQQIEDLSERVGNVASQLGKLTKVVRQMMTNGAAQPVEAAENSPGSPSINTPPQHAATAPPADSAMESPAEMLQIIRLLTENRSEEAQKLLTSLPREVMAANPGIVALVAGAVRIRKGEFEIAAAALQKARSILGESRLLRVVKFLENQLPG